MKLLDPEIREALFWHLELSGVKFRPLEEIPMRTSRADILVVTDGAIVGYEIKSDADSYARLKTQVLNYGRFCDYCNIIIGLSHSKHIEEHIPDFWGISTVRLAGEKVVIEVVREAKANTHWSMTNKLCILWGRELANLCRRFGLKCSGAKHTLRQRLVENVPFTTLNRSITDELFERDYTTIK
jgi:hypothetical protein